MLTIGQDYQLRDVTTDSGHILNKGGMVRCVHIFPKGVVPDPDLIEQYYGYKDRQANNFKGVALAFKEDRFVLDRISPKEAGPKPKGKPVILLAKYTKFLSPAGEEAPAPPVAEFPTSDLLTLGATFQAPPDSTLGQFQVSRLEQDGQVVILAYRNELRSGEVVWSEGQPIPVGDFLKAVTRAGCQRIS